MPARLSAFVIWALVAASVAFWGLRLFVVAPPAPAHATLVADGAGARADLTRLFGVAPAAPLVSVQSPAMSSRFQLTGVMAPKTPGDQGVALIAVDGKMPHAFRVGAGIDGDMVLQSVSLRTASIGPTRGAPAVVLELPLLPPPATGTLSGANLMAPPGSTVPSMNAAPMPVAPPQSGPPGKAPPQRAVRSSNLTEHDEAPPPKPLAQPRSASAQ